MSLAVALLLAAAQPPQAPAPAQAPQSVEVPLGPGVATAYEQAASALGNCWEASIARLPPTISPEAGGEAVEAQCAAEIARIEQLSIQMINANAQTSPAQKAFGIARVQQMMATSDVRIAQLIRDQRAQAAPR